MHDLLPETMYDAPPSRRWTEHVSWGAMLALGWLIYEVTARPSFGIAVACGKFGWNDFLTAHWLLRTDPERNRGRTCFWFYIASGLWKVTIAAFLATGSLLILMVALNDNAPRELFGAGLTAAIGVTLLAVIPLIGVFHARCHGVRVWVDATVHESRQANLWPPEATGMNATMGLLFPALLVPIVVTAVATARLGLVAMLVSVFGEGILIWSLLRGVCADSPIECWRFPPIDDKTSEAPYRSDDDCGAER
jgi:hypothetical protein